MSLSSNSAVNAASGAGGNGNGGNGGGKKPKLPPFDPKAVSDFAKTKAQLIAMFLGILAIVNVGTPPSRGNLGKMRDWVTGLLHSNHHVRDTRFSPGARAFVEAVDMVAAIGPEAFTWLVEFLNEHFDATNDDDD